MKRIKLKSILKESFWRLPGHVIVNELYTTIRKLRSIYDSQLDGNDLDVKELNKVISELQKIKKEARQFNSIADVPRSFRREA